MHPAILTLVALVTMVLAAPPVPLYPTNNGSLIDPSNSTSTDLVHTVRDSNQCLANKNHYPTISMWERGMKQFCDSYGNQKVYWDNPLTITMTLTGHDKKPIYWIYKVQVDNNNPPGATAGGFRGEDSGPLQWSYYPTTGGCKAKFMRLTKDKGGGLGKAYCNWDSEKHNIHDKLMLGGKYDELLNPKFWATVTWETRPKKGQKGV